MSVCLSICPAIPLWGKLSWKWRKLGKLAHVWVNKSVSVRHVRACTCVCACVFYAARQGRIIVPPGTWVFFAHAFALALTRIHAILLFSLVLSPSDWLHVIWPSGKWINQQTEWLPDEWAFQVAHTPLAVNSLDSAFHHKGLSFLIQK